MVAMMKIRRSLNRFRKCEDGGPTVEFAILFPAFIAVFLSAFEAGLMMVRNVMLDRSVDLAVRELRLGTPIPPTYEEFKATICRNALIIEECESLVQVQLEPIDLSTFAMPTNAPNCIDEGLHNATIDPINPLDSTNYDGGENDELMIVRVCALFKPLFPGTVLGLQMPRFDPNDGSDDAKYALVVTSAFVNEPTRTDEAEGDGDASSS